MKKFKYFYLNDNTKEAYGTLYAENLHDAYFIASRMKELPLAKFRELFGVERV